jgi:hypothetical protein
MRRSQVKIVKRFRTIRAWLMLSALLFSPGAGLLGSAVGTRSYSSSPHGDKISSDLLRDARRTGTEDRTHAKVIGIIISDGIIVGDSHLQAQSVMTNGDNTSAMR